MQEPGYAFLYISNEHPYLVDVYFDDVTISLTPGKVVQEDDYYPFGLSFNSYSRENSLANQYKFNGIEEQDELGLNVLGSFFRTGDPTTGKWWQIDPKPGFDISMYSMMNNNPILMSDPLGDTTKVYSTRGKLLNTINDSHENQVHFMSKKDYKNMSQGEGESDDEFASRVRDQSIAFVGQNTVKDMEGIEKESTGDKKEIAFTGEISKTKEIRLKKLSVDGSNQFDNVNIGRQLKDKNTSGTFLFGHIHHGGFATKSPLKLGTPTMPDDYQAQLKDSQGNYRSSPALIGYPGGFSIYGTSSSHSRGNISDAQPPSERISYSFYKQSKKK